MKNKVTIQDIADALQLSRITVSKVLNNSPNVSADTRELVLQKVKEMNYKTINYTNHQTPEPLQMKSFAFVMHMAPDAFHIGSSIITQLQQELRKKNYTLTLHTITQEDIDSMTLPPNLNKTQVAGIICLEIFHAEYSKLLCSLGIPLLFIDACVDFSVLNLHCDLLMMENRTSVYRMLTFLCRKYELTSMGFVGDKDHCLSFRERYEGFFCAANTCGIDTKPYQIIAEDRFYGQEGWMARHLRQMEKLPQLFFCANDILAQILIQNLNELGRQVTRNVMVCGFDGLPTINPLLNNLTTVRIPTTDLGSYAANLIFSRVQCPERLSSTTYLPTEICFRDNIL
ncbi:MAG: LacI family DNA-binding transcriptional regulator [Lachnospiraceae bacterium]|nr:LacI family DNA-binding transcriptional regulator [Lachnospiraceae bacterium]